MNIYVTYHEVYGKETVYPFCEKAQLFARIAGTKTLTQSTLDLVASLGYTIVDAGR